MKFTNIWLDYKLTCESQELNQVSFLNWFKKTTQVKLNYGEFVNYPKCKIIQNSNGLNLHVILIKIWIGVAILDIGLIKNMSFCLASKILLDLDKKKSQ